MNVVNTVTKIIIVTHNHTIFMFKYKIIPIDGGKSVGYYEVNFHEDMTYILQLFHLEYTQTPGNDTIYFFNLFYT